MNVVTTLRYVTGWFVAIVILHGTPLWAQTLFPEAGVIAIEALYKGVNPQDDAARRIRIVKVCEQMQFALGESWGNKKRTGLNDSFISPDSIAHREADGTISVWDIQSSSGAITVGVGQPAQHPNLSPDDATLMDCTATDHLGGTKPDPGTNEPDPGEPVDLRPIWVELTTLRVEVEELRVSLDLALRLINGLHEKVWDDSVRIEALEARPMPLMGCRAAIAGIPISCRLQ